MVPVRWQGLYNGHEAIGLYEIQIVWHGDISPAEVTRNMSNTGVP